MPVGLRVVTIDGTLVGVVFEVRAHNFAVQTDGGPLSLDMGSVFTVDDERVTLVCARGGVEKYVVGA
jgi:hypothetical protein